MEGRWGRTGVSLSVGGSYARLLRCGRCGAGISGSRDVRRATAYIVVVPNSYYTNVCTIKCIQLAAPQALRACGAKRLRRFAPPAPPNGSTPAPRPPPLRFPCGGAQNVPWSTKIREIRPCVEFRAGLAYASLRSALRGGPVHGPRTRDTGRPQTAYLSFPGKRPGGGKCSIFPVGLQNLQLYYQYTQLLFQNLLVK